MVSVDELMIDSEFEALLPSLKQEELQGLEADILENGCTDPLMIWDGVIVDGHNRYGICTKHGLGFETKDIEFPDRVAAKIWIIQRQKHRRNLEPYQAYELNKPLKELFAEKARQRQAEGHNNLVQYQRAPVCPNSDEPDMFEEPETEPSISEMWQTDQERKETNESESQRTDERLAEAAGMGRDSWRKCEYIDEHADDETKEKLRDGGTSIHKAYIETREKNGNPPHVSRNSGENEWYTPKECIDAAFRAMGSIDLDPASTAEANEVIGAAQIYTIDDDGLTREWHGNVWMNPPYAQPATKQFAEKFAEEWGTGRIKSAIILVNNATETGWFNTFVGCAHAICFPRGRIRFWSPRGEAAAPLQGQAIIYAGDDVQRFRDEFEQIGFTVVV